MFSPLAEQLKAVNDVSIGSVADGAQAVKEEGLATWAPEACQIADLAGRFAHGDRIGSVKAKSAGRMAYRVDLGGVFRGRQKIGRG
jgi:hypothetical protein